jgi:transcriptional regulator with XRE-family HTH domain
VEFITKTDKKKADGGDFRAARHSLQLSQKEFAKLFGYSTITAVRWESGSVMKICRMMNVTVLLLNRVVSYCKRDQLVEELRSFRRNDDDLGMLLYLANLEALIEQDKQKALEESLSRPYLRPSPRK